MDSVAALPAAAAPPVSLPAAAAPAAAVPSSAGELCPVVTPNPNPGVEKQLMHKNRLQEYTQRAGVPLPAYHTVNEGFPHAPQFRSTVMVDGVTFRSNLTFSHRKEAEQDVAKLALEGLCKKIRDEGAFFVSQDTMFCKSILHEFAVKMNKEKPTYSTSQSEGLLPVFVSVLVFDGKTYPGAAGKNKKEAEQLAARAAIQSILAQSNSRNVMSQIIKSKGKLYAATHKTCPSGTLQLSSMGMIRQTDNGSSSSGIKCKVQATSADNPCEQFLLRPLATVSAVQSDPPGYKMLKEEYTCQHSAAIFKQGCQVLGSSNMVPGLFGETCYTNENQNNHEIQLIGPVEQSHAHEDATVIIQGKRSGEKHEQDCCKKARNDAL